MNKDARRRLAGCLALQLLLLTCSMPATAADRPGQDRWEFAGEVFLWGASLKGHAITGDDIDVPLHDVLDSLDMAFMGSLAARKNNWTLFADAIYLDMGDKANIPLNLGFQPNAAEVNLGLKGFISTLGAAYQVGETERSQFSLLAGGRYLSLDADLGLRIDPIVDKRISRSGSNWDFIVGGRGRTNLNEKWYFHYYADIGTGDSDLTWQALAGLNYRFNKVDVTLGYAYMDWDFDNDSLIRDMSLSGPYAGIKFRF